MTIKIETFVEPAQAAKDTAIDAVNLNDEFIRQPGLVYFYTAAAAKAERQESAIKLRLELKEADVETSIRMDARSTGEKITDKSVSAAIASDKGVQELEVALIKAREVTNGLKGIVEALRHKRDMLILRGNMTRDEIKAKLNVEAEAYASAGGSDVSERHRRLAERMAS